MSKSVLIMPARAISQQEIDDAAEISRMFTSNTRDHLTRQRDLRHEARFTTPTPLTQRLNFNLNKES